MDMISWFGGFVIGFAFCLVFLRYAYKKGGFKVVEGDSDE